MSEKIATHDPGITLRFARESDVPIVLQFIKDLAEYEKLSHQVVADAQMLHDSMFGERAVIEVLIAENDGEPVGFAVFFHSFSTFLGRPGIYLEDLFVQPEFRGRGIGDMLLSYLAKLALKRGCARFEWAVLDWNQPAIDFYKNRGARAEDGWTVFCVTGNALAELGARFPV